jgi:hypothetical protein
VKRTEEADFPVVMVYLWTGSVPRLGWTQCYDQIQTDLLGKDYADISDKISIELDVLALHDPSWASLESVDGVALCTLLDC